ncbi:MAG: hypothetical protein ACI9TV_003219 [Sulfurimonas sp.]|jgi:hypothetical protein|uniref:hypothetical protein n=1 Tax=Sulfurimonas sp. TaxID=2022749 RepID=UPI0039E30D68
MFPLLHKIIETRPSNNITYEGGLGKYNPNIDTKYCHSLYTKNNISTTEIKDKS